MKTSFFLPFFWVFHHYLQFIFIFILINFMLKKITDLMKWCHKKWQIYMMERQIGKSESTIPLESLDIDHHNYWLSHGCWFFYSQSQCLKLHVMNHHTHQSHYPPEASWAPPNGSPPCPISHTISPLFCLLCFYCWALRSGPNGLIYSTINWSRAVCLIKTCNRLQGRRRRRGVGVPLLTKWLY